MNRKVAGKITRILILCSLVFVVTLFGRNTKAEASSKYPYLIKVNKKCNTVTVYKKDSKGNYTKPVKAFVCSTGSATPIGTFHTQAKYRWKILSHEVWGQYSTRITGSILFHSVWYYEKDPSTLSIRQYNRLGTTASAGCVRLTTKDAKWIYDNCGLGTTVVIYNSNNPGPLGKPKAIKISKHSWDPTDVWSKNNPWNKKKPSITGTSNKTVCAGTTINLKSGVKAYDTCGNNITSKLKVDTSKLNMKKAGTYKVTYSVKDTLGRTAKKTIKVKVTAPEKVVIKGASNKVYRYSDYKNKKLDSYVMDGVYAKAGSHKLAKKYIWYSAKVIQDDKAALVYRVTYTAKNPVNGTKTKKKVTFTLDKQAPVVTCEKLYMTKEQFTTLKNELAKKKYSQASFKDNVTKTSKLSIETTVSKYDDNVYRIRYKVKDQVGNTTKAYQKVYLLTSPKLSVKQSTVTVNSESEIKQKALANVTFTATGKDYTSKFKSKISVKVNKLETDATYEAVYTLKLGSQTLTAKAVYVVEEKK